MAYNNYEKIIETITANQSSKTPKAKKTQSTQIVFAIQDYKKAEQQTLTRAFLAGYKPILFIESSQVSNKYYKGDEYSIKFNGFAVTIVNKTKNYTKSFSVYNFVMAMPEKDKIEFLKTIQTLPGEVLEDLSIEIDRFNSTTGQNMHTHPDNPDFVAGGFYKPAEDSITTSPKHIVHELGHAIDYNSDAKSNAANNKEFKDAFAQELRAYLNAGHVRYDYRDKKTWKNGVPAMQLSNYCTANEREMFAEIYSLCMTGKCQSANTIAKFFPRTLEIGKKLLAQDRKLANINRHEGMHNKLQHYLNK